jgi:ligand-binding sensor domain-containing protein/AraC-like DNA-binding protein
MKKGRHLKAAVRQRVLIGIIILLFSWCPSLALDPDKSIDSYLVDHWKLSDGIPSSMITAITQTPDGYLWMVTETGLVKFDGITFSVIPFLGIEKASPGQDAIPRTIYLDRAGRLWVSSPGALTSYDCQTRQFKTITEADGLPGDEIRHLNGDKDGNIWICLFSGYVYRFNPSTGKLTAFDESHGLKGKDVNAIIEDQMGNLLFGTRYGGVFRFLDGKFSRLPLPVLNGFLTRMCEDHKGVLWIGTNRGLVRKTGTTVETYTKKDGLTDNHIADILEDSERSLWIATHNGGLNRVKRRQDGEIEFERTVKTVKFMCLFEDREGSLWGGTYDGGLIRLKDAKFTSYSPLQAFQQETLFSMYQGGNGDTWVGTVSGKLLHFRNDKLIESLTSPEFSGSGIAAIAEDSVGNLWIGTNGRGVLKKENNTFTRYTAEDGLAENSVTSIYKDSRNNLWFSTYDGVSVFRFTDGTVEFLTNSQGLAGKRVYNVHEDRRHNIWIATDNGITVLKSGNIKNRGIKNYLEGVPVTWIYEDPSLPEGEGCLCWIATYGHGLQRIRLKGEEKVVFSFNTSNGMPTNFIYQFFEDRQGYFWCMSNRGILRVSKSRLDRFAGGEIDRIDCVSFGISDGLDSPEFSDPYSRHSAFKNGKGEMWFLTKKGISIVNPDKILINKIPPLVVIEEVFFNGESVPLPLDADAGTFKGLTDVSFRFTAPTFLSPEKVKFQYQLEGVDEEWVFLSPGSERTAHYKDLEPGKYIFHVTACNAGGVWNQTGASITFTIESYFYQTILFKFILLLFMVLLVTVVYVLRKIHRKSMLKKKKKDKYRDSLLNSQFAKVCITELRRLMEVEKVFIEENITLSSLAAKLSLTEGISITPHQLSQLLNENLNRKFSDYINSHRIEEAKRIMLSPKGSEKKITAVALEVGFISQTAFYKAFKKFTGMTPKQFKKEVTGKV